MANKTDTITRIFAYLTVALGTMGKLQELAALLQPAADEKRELTVEEEAALDTFLNNAMNRLHAANAVK